MSANNLAEELPTRLASELPSELAIAKYRPSEIEWIKRFAGLAALEAGQNLNDHVVAAAEREFLQLGELAAKAALHIFSHRIDRLRPRTQVERDALRKLRILRKVLQAGFDESVMRRAGSEIMLRLLPPPLSALLESESEPAYTALCAMFGHATAEQLDELQHGFATLWETIRSGEVEHMVNGMYWSQVSGEGGAPKLRWSSIVREVEVYLAEHNGQGVLPITGQPRPAPGFRQRLFLVEEEQAKLSRRVLEELQTSESMRNLGQLYTLLTPPSLAALQAALRQLLQTNCLRAIFRVHSPFGERRGLKDYASFLDVPKTLTDEEHPQRQFEVGLADLEVLFSPVGVGSG